MSKTIQRLFFILMLLSVYISAAMAEVAPPSCKDALTLDEAAAALKVPGAAAPYVNFTGTPTDILPFNGPPFTQMNPIKLFDNFYFVGTTKVGAFVIDTGNALVMIDTGIGEIDSGLMVADMKKLGLDPAKIKLLLISHEHNDHYGGVQFLKKNVCPNAKVAMSLIGWNMLQTTPLAWAFMNPRPQSVDIFLTDGMKLMVENTTIQMVYTPGHSAGCMSFIIPVKDNGEAHVAGIMGGSGVWTVPLDARLYKASVEYFKSFADAAKCDVGLGVHSQEEDFAALRIRKQGEPHPLVLGTEKFDTVYLKKFRDMYQFVIESGKMASYPMALQRPKSF
ncbi:MAG: MBL fold metallo-hydrolase [Candidatus Ozemobacteraceae bacterium]